MAINVVPDNERSSFLSKHFKDPVFDITVFIIANNLFNDYSGGFWIYATADFKKSDDFRAVTAPFLYPDVNKDITLTNVFSGEECTVSPVLGGMILTLYAINYQMERQAGEGTALHDLYYSLRDAIISECSANERMDAWFALVD